MEILVVDDDESVCKELKDFFETKGQHVQYKLSVDDGLKELQQNNYDCAVLDVDFGQGNPDGENLIQQMNDMFVRVPVVVHSGNPDSAERFADKIFGIYTRGCDLQDVLDRLFEIEKTGITDMLGKKGYLEKQIQECYENFFLKEKDFWIERSKNNSDQTKDILFRSLIYRLEQHFPCGSNYEDFYLFSSDDFLHTGSIVKKNGCGDYFLIVTPECDIEYRDFTDDGKTEKRPKVNVITLCKIEDISAFGLSKNGVGRIVGNSVKPLFQNTNDDKELLRYHWCPPISEFQGGFLNFTATESCLYRDFFSQFTIEKVRVSFPFMKNILARFSSYFSRQGQPDLDYNPFLKQLKWTCKENGKLIKP